MKFPQIHIRNIRDLGPQFVENDCDMVGQDGAFSIPLNGKTLWYFGDTLIGRRVPGESLWYPGGNPVGPYDMSSKGGIRRMINNCGLILPQQSGHDGLQNYRYICDKTGELKTLIPLLPGEDHDWVRIWCMHGVKTGGKIYLFFIKVQMLENGPFPVNFDLTGSGIAVGSEENWEFTRIHFNSSDLFWKKADPQFGSAALKDLRSDWLYLYGIKKNKQGIQQCHLARVNRSEIENREKYQFLTSTQPSWSEDVVDALSLFNGPPNELSVTFNPHLNAYLAVHSLDLSGKIVGRTAEHPWGPWSEPQVFATIIPERKKPLPYPPLVYAAKEHPGLRYDDGRVIYITYVDFEEYFPHLLEIELA
jgi:hypothetical protein